jgi:hypothetical protein
VNRRCKCAAVIKPSAEQGGQQRLLRPFRAPHVLNPQAHPRSHPCRFRTRHVQDRQRKQLPPLQHQPNGASSHDRRSQALAAQGSLACRSPQACNAAAACAPPRSLPPHPATPIPAVAAGRAAQASMTWLCLLREKAGSRPIIQSIDMRCHELAAVNPPWRPRPYPQCH